MASRQHEKATAAEIETMHDEALIAELLELFLGTVESGEHPSAEAFARRFLASMDATDLRTAEPAALAAAVARTWQQGAVRRAGHPSIAIETSEDRTTIVVVNDDMPFLLDSITSDLQSRSRSLHRVAHPIVIVHRDGEGRRVTVMTRPEPDGSAESAIYLETDPIEDPVSYRTDLEELLLEVRSAVDDWEAMRGRVREIVSDLDIVPTGVDPEEVAETQAFLRWLEDHHFTFLGYRFYRRRREPEDEFLAPVPDSGLGTLRRLSSGAAERARRSLTLEVRNSLSRREPMWVTKANRRARVHRDVHMDVVGVRAYDDAGEVIGEHRLVGLFTSVAYARSASRIPFLRRKVAWVVDQAGLLEGSHDAKALVHVLEDFPRDELFQIDGELLARQAMAIVHLHQRPRVGLLVRRDEYERFVSCLVYVPRDAYDSTVRERIRRILEEGLGGEVSAFYTRMGNGPLARAHYIVKTPDGGRRGVDLEALEARVVEAARTWQDRLRGELVRRRGHASAAEVMLHYAHAFPPSYVDRYDAATAVEDLVAVDRVVRTGALGLHLHRPDGSEPDRIRLKLYHRDKPIYLSEILPMLEGMGVTVLDEMPHRVHPAGFEAPVWLHDFGLRAEIPSIDLAGVRAEFQATLRRVWSGEVENDHFNRLVLSAGLRWHEVVVLRAYARYLRQIGFGFSQRYMASILVRHPAQARGLVDLFRTFFDPDDQEGARSRAARILADLRQGLERVTSLDEDRILRRFRNLVQATLRTNYFQPGPKGRRKPYLSFKLDSRSVRALPEPRPRFEVFVYSPRVEGIHLRGGKVARGGIRWSDRQEDFRTEILGLVKAQMVKNAVIVPVGSKGGFVVKHPPTDGGREAYLAEGHACYSTLIRGLLDLTDNLKEGVVVPPPNVVRRDDDDPYLVVAADKGTATFSDLANRVAAEYDFWLGDAFASGGSAGYDHKKMGITARGAWESVKRHFRELGHDIQRDDTTVVGVGDMSGDVFGNGLLLSRRLKLVGAFNHLHVFLDPDPDPEVSFRERQRLFQLPRSTWQDYDPTLISAGGGVFDRQAKSIPLSPEVQTLLGVDRKTMTPNELVQSLLGSPVDLLWLGGIGTFVKASSEAHRDAGDRVNDPVRLDGRQLRCRVIGEGANLGLTQRGRIEYALAGGKVNTDFIDNSGGVDCSDHEVNIKILLSEAVASGRLDRTARDRLLVEMTEEVADLVLRDNYLQSQALTQAEDAAATLLDEHRRLVRALEREGRLDRRIEALPEEEDFVRRAAQGQPLTRPELAVLLAYTKIEIYDAILGSNLPEEALLANDLRRYFPRPIVARFEDLVATHRLRREIISTFVTNSIVNRVGPSLFFRVSRDTGRDAVDLARAVIVARDAFGLRAVWTEVEGLDGTVGAETQTRMLREAGRLLERGTRWVLARHEEIPISSVVAATEPGISTLTRELGELLPAGARRTVRRRTQEYVRRGVPEPLAERVAGLERLGAAFDILELASSSSAGVAAAGRTYFAIGERLGIDWLERQIGTLDADSHWEVEAGKTMVAELQDHHRAIGASVLEGGEGRRALTRWVDERRVAVEAFELQLGELKAATALDLAMLAVATHRLGRLARR